MKSTVIAAVAGGLVLGAAAFIPMGAVANSTATPKSETSNQKIQAPEVAVDETVDTTEDSNSVESGTAGIATTDPATGTGTKSSKYGFSKGDDNDDDQGDDEHEDEHEDESEDD